jgi:hypothetical protein
MTTELKKLSIYDLESYIQDRIRLCDSIESLKKQLVLIDISAAEVLDTIPNKTIVVTLKKKAVDFLTDKLTYNTAYILTLTEDKGINLQETLQL